LGRSGGISFKLRARDARNRPGFANDQSAGEAPFNRRPRRRRFRPRRARKRRWRAPSSRDENFRRARAGCPPE